MKRTILVYLLCASLTTYAQQWVQKINDPDYKNRLSNGLMVGDRMPDIPLGTIINNTTGKSKFSEFKGKLIMLDFWHTACSSCIAGFPHMEALQKKFEDKIQIFLVNPSQTITDIKKYLPNFKFPNLPCIILDSTGSAKKFLDMFPVRSAGHQVWIDGNGVIKLRGASNNNTVENIKHVLEGEKIFILQDNGTAPIFDKDYPYYKLLGDFTSSPITYGSIFTAFNSEYDPENGGIVENVLDSANGTRRNTYVNWEILKLYKKIFKNYLKPAQEKVLYGPSPESSYLGVYGSNYFILPKDTLRYTIGFLKNEHRSAKDYISSKLCYEQVIPIDLSAEKQNLYMLEDLNRYLGSKYGTTAKLEKRNVPCYILVRTSNIDKLKSKNAEYASQHRFVKNGVELNEYKKQQFRIIGDYIVNCRYLKTIFLDNNRNGGPTLFLNETGFDKLKSIDIILPNSNSLKTMDDYRKALEAYDLDIKIAEREIEFVVITDNSGN